IRCWKDNWVPEVGPLNKLIPANVNIDFDFLLNEMVTEEGLWNLDIFKIWLSDDVIWRIMRIMASWSAKDDKWKCAWKLPGLQRVRFFLWTVLKQSLLSNVERVKWGIAVDLSCPLCGHASEGILYILKDCTTAKAIWRQVIQSKSEKWLLMNTDGAVQLQYGNAVAEEIVRDETGDWVFGYNRYLGKCSIFDAELWGILEGLKLIQRGGYDKMIIQSDSLEVVKAIQRSFFNSSNSALIRRIQRILSQEGQWLLLYIPIEQNQVAGCLAKLTLVNKEELQVFDSPPMESLVFIDSDRIRGFFPL
ncbi:hypothetical protein Goshw_000925, partial [Gossypium schwendimanii]|nr:hypothetical protein [Gossypium schwendimanii]